MDFEVSKCFSQIVDLLNQEMIVPVSLRLTAKNHVYPGMQNRRELVICCVLWCHSNDALPSSAHPMTLSMSILKNIFLW